MNALQFQFQSLRISTVLSGASVLPRRVHQYPLVRAERPLQGKVICVTNDKTVNVVVYRRAPHPKYKKIVKYKKKYQAHDPGNLFQVGDMVLLQKCRPISKTKSYLALKVPPRVNPNKIKKQPQPQEELAIPLESDQDQDKEQQEEQQA